MEKSSPEMCATSVIFQTTWQRKQFAQSGHPEVDLIIFNLMLLFLFIFKYIFIIYKFWVFYTYLQIAE
jgi:hypothetical protein